MKKILVIEDESAIREFVSINLKRAGYDPVEAENGEKGLEIFTSAKDFPVILLDVMLPGIDGFEVCRAIRETDTTVGIIMLTAKTQEVDKISGLMTGADDYISKPFSPSELVARIDSLCRRVETQSILGEKNKKVDEITTGIFKLNLRKRTLTKNGEPLELTQIEYQIMEYIMTNPDTCIQRIEIARRVWGEDYIGEDKIVDVNIRRLRMKIEDDPSEPRRLLTVWGKGYKWNTF